MSRTKATIAVLIAAFAASGCSGVQSALDPAGTEAAAVARLFGVMTVAAALIWLAVMAALLYAGRRGRRVHSEKAAGRMILWAGAVGPTALLTILLAYGLWMMPPLRPSAAIAGGGLHVEVVGEQFWWRITYHPADGGPVLSANELRLPVGARVAFSLESADVIHSFWIPPLGGKMDLVPGRVNRLSLEATKPGVYRGPCAEFCGPSHALMAFSAVAMQQDEFERWLAREAAPSPGADGEGLTAFLAHGCGACHAIRGTDANGVVGPDLSHVGSRDTIAAGTLPNTEAAIARFIAEPGEVKPGARMPAFGMLPEEDIRLIARYLKQLE